MRAHRSVPVLAVVLGVALGWVEWVTWRASGDSLPAPAGDARQSETGESVLVLGCPSSILHRWRVRIAVRSTDPATARFVFSGGAVKGPVSEARMMADYAVQELGVSALNVVLEDRSRTTVENVVNSAPLLADGPIKVASNTFHARRARRIMHLETPELAARLVRARDYVPFEWGPLHLIMLAHEAHRRRRDMTGGCLRSRRGCDPGGSTSRGHARCGPRSRRAAG